MSREPFALVVARKNWHILIDPDDVTATYQMNNGSLSYNIFIEEVMQMINISERHPECVPHTRHTRRPNITLYKIKPENNSWTNEETLL